MDHTRGNYKIIYALLFGSSAMPELSADIAGEYAGDHTGDHVGAFAALLLFCHAGDVAGDRQQVSSSSCWLKLSGLLPAACQQIGRGFLCPGLPGSCRAGAVSSCNLFLYQSINKGVYTFAVLQ